MLLKDNTINLKVPNQHNQHNQDKKLQKLNKNKNHLIKPHKLNNYDSIPYLSL